MATMIDRTGERGDGAGDGLPRFMSVRQVARYLQKALSLISVKIIYF